MFRLFHRHQWREYFGGAYADEPGGPRTFHEIWWECDCGAVLDPNARRRAKAADAAERLGT
jgi:hypothetical protein